MGRRTSIVVALAFAPVLAAAGSASLSTDGRLVAFVSEAKDLVPDDTNGLTDVFVRDLATQTTERVNATDVAQSDGFSSAALVSGDGRFVVFTSSATNLVPGDANGRPDVFVHDRVTHRIERASVGTDEAEADDDSFALAISADGRVVVFASAANNLVPNDVAGSWKYFSRDRVSGSTERIDVKLDGTLTPGNLRRDIRAATSADGRSVLFVADLPGFDGLYLRDRVRQSTALVAGALDRQRAVSISADTRVVAFSPSGAPTSVVVLDRATGARQLISGNGDSFDAALSADGRYVAFQSAASNLVDGDANQSADVFVYDRVTRTTELVSVSSDELHANDASFSPQISADGRYVQFESRASNLTPGDGNGRVDVFVRDRQLGTTVRVSVTAPPPRAGSLRLAPSRPRAGRLLSVTMPVTHAGRPLLVATVRCAATLAGRRLKPVSGGFGPRAARCAWRVPRNAGAKVLRGTVTAVATTGAAARTFARTVRKP